VTVRCEGRLIALASLYREGAALRPLGAELTDFQDEVAAGLAAALAAQLHGPFARFDLGEDRADAAVHHLAAHWPRARRTLPALLVQHLPGVPMDELLTRLPGRTAQRAKAKLRKLAAAGVEVRTVPPWEVPEAVDRMLALHALQWRERGATPEHLRERFARHLRAAATGMVATERATLREYRLGGWLIACDLQLQGPALVALYVYGVHPDARERVDIAGMLFGESLAYAVRTGCAELSLLRGDEPYAATNRTNSDGDLTPPTTNASYSARRQRSPWSPPSRGRASAPRPSRAGTRHGWRMCDRARVCSVESSAGRGSGMR
jgi:hypothetical protein